MKIKARARNRFIVKKLVDKWKWEGKIIIHTNVKENTENVCRKKINYSERIAEKWKGFVEKEIANKIYANEKKRKAY